MLVHGFLGGAASGVFSPTYNPGDNQYPTELDATESFWQYSNYGPGDSSATAQLTLAVIASASDTVIEISGFTDGSVTDQGSNKPTTHDVFTLNTRADEVKIELISGVYFDSDHTNYPSTNNAVGTFTDGVFFSPVNGVSYGYMLESEVASQTVPPGSPPPTNSEDGRMTSRIRFTFKKAGYANLSVDYLVRSEAQSMSEDVS